ncbi:MAG: hypothetical protein ACE5HA_06435 [Anaerolineae bacterium]
MATQDETWPTWFLAGLFAVAVALLVVALFLWLRGPREAGRVAGVPTAAATARVVLATETVGAGAVTGGTLTPVSMARGAGGTGELSSATEAPASPSVQPARTPAVAVEATGTPAVAPAPTATFAAAMPLEELGEDVGTVEGELALEGRTQFSGIMLLVGGTPIATTEASGVFRLTAPPGLHTIAARFPSYMSIEADHVEVQAGEITQLPAVVLRAGDTDEDGDVDLFDVVRCVISLGQVSTAHADVNGDGMVDFRDVILTQRNYRGASPAPWRASGQ